MELERSFLSGRLDGVRGCNENDNATRWRDSDSQTNGRQSWAKRELSQTFYQLLAELESWRKAKGKISLS